MHAAPVPSAVLPRSWPWLAALAALTALRLVVAATAPLSPDEAYYWVWSRALAPGFLDHPPMVAVWIRAGTALLGPTALGVRLLGPLSAAGGSLLLARAARDLLPEAPGGVGVRAAALLNATLLLGVGAVTMTPDTPLLFFWTATLWALARLLRTGRAVWWLAVGAMAGCALESKYTALLLGAAIGAWLLAVPGARRWLRCWQLWAGLALALALFAPDLAWNDAHHWASFAKQGGRTGDWHPARALGFLLELAAGQLGLATPLVFALCALGTWRAARCWPEPGPALLAVLVLLPAAVFVQHALGDRVQANWPAVLYPAAAVAAAGLARRGWAVASVLGLALAAPVYLQAAAAPLALPRRLDVTLARLGGWDGLAQAVAAQDGGAAFLAADEYGLAAELAWQLRPDGPAALGGSVQGGSVQGKPAEGGPTQGGAAERSLTAAGGQGGGKAAPLVVGVEPRWVLFDLPPARIGGREGLLLRSARRTGPPDPASWSSAVELGRLGRVRGGVTAEEYRLYRVTARPGLADAVTLPHPGAR